MPRLCAPEEVARAVVVLASDDAAYVNATTLMVDGGATVYLRADSPRLDEPEELATEHSA
jgi:NAD(P)-dependent dehydrogenase (short-subunit alcohol dehydrogenase family)